MNGSFFFRDEQEQTILSKIRNVYLTNRTFQNIFDVWIVFCSLQKSFLENGMDEKFWKNSEMFLLGRSFDWVIFPSIGSSRENLVACLDTFSDVRNRIFLTSSHVSGERYERKVLKKIPGYFFTDFSSWNVSKLVT